MNIRIAVAILLGALLLCPLAALADTPADQERALEQTGLVDPNAVLTGKIRVTVLPFQTPDGVLELEQYGEGTMDSLIDGLKNIPQFIVVDRGRIEHVIKEQAFTQTGLVDPGTAVRLGKILGAQIMITGSIQLANDRLSITASFIDVQSGRNTPNQTVTGPSESIFDLQDQLVMLFLNKQNIPLTPELKKRVNRILKSTASREAYAHYLKGRKAYLLFTAEGYSEAVQWYQKAIQVDPEYALAYAGLAEAWEKWGTQKRRNGEPFYQDYKQAYAASKKALELNSDLPEAHRSFGRAAKYLGLLTSAGFEEEVRRALALNANDAETWYQLWYASGNNSDPDQEYIRTALSLNPEFLAARVDRASLLADKNRIEEALSEYRAALQINPNFAYAHNNLAADLLTLGRYDEALAEFQEAVRINPNYANAHCGLGLVYMKLERWEDAVREFQEALRINPDHRLAAERLPRARIKLRGQ